MSVIISLKSKSLQSSAIESFCRTWNKWFNNISLEKDAKEESIPSFSDEKKNDNNREAPKEDGVLKFLQSRKEEAKRFMEENKIA